jgi:glucan-binding YG repeat protein
MKFKSELEYLEIKWACNECIGRKKALISNTITTQRESNTAPVFAFFDLKSNCAKCHTDFIFEKEEWKYWIDDLNFYYQTTKKYCERCHPIEKLKKRLSSNIIELEAKSFGQEYVDLALEVSEIYLKLDNREKSKGYLKSIINKFKPDDNLLLKNRIKEAYNRI